jgi:hypothetical protein
MKTVARGMFFCDAPSQGAPELTALDKKKRPVALPHSNVTSGVFFGGAVSAPEALQQKKVRRDALPT